MLHIDVPSTANGTPYESVIWTPGRDGLANTNSDISVIDLSHGQRLSFRRTTVMLMKGGSRRVLSTVSIVGLCYFAVSGGPIGSEQIISSGGPLVGFISLLVFPIVWSIPIALVTAELSTVFPEDGGYTVWVLHAFGPFWAFQTGYWAWISGVIDNAIYPALAVTSFTNAYGLTASGWTAYLVKAAISIMLSLPNFFGVRLVGNGMAVLSVFVMVPFCVLCLWGFAQSKSYEAFGEIRRENIVLSESGDQLLSMSGPIKVDWSLLLNSLLWNFNGAVSMSVFGGEVHNPAKSYPWAMTISVLLITLTYLIPLSGAVAFNSPHWVTWGEKSFCRIARAIGGELLGNCVLLATFCSNAGMFITELFCDSFQILGMAECDLAPALLRRRNERFDTPHNAIIASLAIILVLISFKFQQILKMTNALSAFHLLLVLAAFLKLRLSRADIARPVRAPGNFSCLVLMLLLPAALLFFIGLDVFRKPVPAALVAVVLVCGFLYAHIKKFTSTHFKRLHEAN